MEVINCENIFPFETPHHSTSTFAVFGKYLMAPTVPSQWLDIRLFDDGEIELPEVATASALAVISFSFANSL